MPPRAAYNWGAVVSVGGEAAAHHWQLGEEVPLGPIEQRGAGAYTLCETCNSNTGAWYGDHYAAWVHQVAGALLSTGMNPSLLHPYLIFPARVLKQVVSMFLSVNPTLRAESPDLARYVLTRYARRLPSPYRIATYYLVDGVARWIGHASRSRDGRRWYWISEVSFSPLGFVMTRGGETSFRDGRLCDITRFGEYGFEDFERVYVAARVLPSITNLPGDYRSRAEVMRGPNPRIIVHDDGAAPRELPERPKGFRVPMRRRPQRPAR